MSHHVSWFAVRLVPTGAFLQIGPFGGEGMQLDPLELVSYL